MRVNQSDGLTAEECKRINDEWARADINRYRLLCGKLFDALAEYSDPEFYHAISFLADPPCGGFADDWGDVEHPHYPDGKPGRLARETIAQVQKEFGDLIIISEEIESP